MVPFAVTLSDLIEKGGAYVGIAAFFGLAILTILYFAQAREVKRLREWAGRAPERAQELEQRVMAQAEQARRVRAQPQKPATPAAAASATPAAGAATPAPATAAAGATAAAPKEGDAATAGDAAAAEQAAQPATPAAANGAAPGAEEQQAEGTATEQPAVARAGEQEPVTTVVPSVPGQAAPAGTAEGQTMPRMPAGTPPPSRPAPPRPGQPRRAPAPAAAAAPLRSGATATRRPGQPPRRPGQAPAPAPSGGGRRRTGLIVTGVIIGLAIIAVAVVLLLGRDGGDNGAKTSAKPAPNASATSSPTPDATRRGGGSSTASRSDTTVAVLNGTTIQGLASSIAKKLAEAGFASGPTANYTDQARSASVVFYAGSGSRRAAFDAAKMLGITDVQPIIDPARQLAPGADVVVVVGADQSP
jgi:hypothetical protein